jgi:hypothetical protein
MFRTAILVAVAIAGAIGLWSQMPTVPEIGRASTVSAQELHALAHVEGLPVADFEDYSLIYPAVAEK